jgi:hypothetical protein
MSDSYYKKPHAYLNADNADLQFVFAKAKRLQELSRNVSVYFDANVAPYCQVANIEGNKLIVLVANGSIATQLRFQMADMLRKFRSDRDPRLQKITDIQYKVHPSFSPSPMAVNLKQKQNMPLLSAETAKSIRDFAESLQDPKLKEIMEKIAGRTKEKA